MSVCSVDDVDDAYDWRCFYCGQGFFDGTDRFVVDEENCCEGCMDEVEVSRAAARHSS